MGVENSNLDSRREIDNEISLKELILQGKEWVRYLASKWYILLIGALIGGGLGLLYAINKKPIYTATTTFVLESGENGGLSKYAGMAAMMGFELGGSAGGLFEGDNILELYKSRTMIEKTLLSPADSNSDELLIDRYISYKKLRASWAEHPELATLDFHRGTANFSNTERRLRDSLISNFWFDINRNVLTVGKPDKKLSIVEVNVESNDEIFSKAFNESLVQHVNQFYVKTKTAKSALNIALLQFKVDSVRSVMSGSIYTAANVVDATPNLNPTRQAQRIAPSQQAQFSAETNKAILGQLVQNLELSKMNHLQEQPLIQIVDSPIYPLKKESLGKVKAGVVGGILGGIFVMSILVFRRLYGLLMK